MVCKKTWEESKKMWHIAGPAILTAIFQFSIGVVTVAYVGHMGGVELAAISIVQNVIEGFAYGILLGMGSALETLCGQAVGAGQLNMLGIYMQRSWIITGVTALILTPVYILTSPILKGLHQNHDIAEMAGKFAIWVIPELFAYAVNFPLQKFLQSQSKVWVMTIISGFGLGFHYELSTLGVDDRSGIQHCCQCESVQRTRGSPSKGSEILRTALIGLLFSVVVLISRTHLPNLFTDVPEVARETAKIGYLLGPTILLNSIQPVLSGVAIGAGWQSMVALINTGCYYLFGLPIGAVLGFKFKLNALGIWSGMLVGCLVQTVILMVISYRTNWQKEAFKAEERIRTWGGLSEPQEHELVPTSPKKDNES
ncbi:Protein TRANSPARENT TESTA 12 [Acorus calamus]|uniref:Protein TRANSPARENT TESTA 12 n=1 Tax=Acorus calamus TaxID=4465 RepID=A0AAV9CTB6_ACOCL|nr:Protein TRANSPARENT TESTA 12 [Acorus calamus]